jgi:mRNA interferase YafQ
MLKPEFSGQFKRDYKLAIKRGCDPKKLEEVITLLCNEPDWLLVYKVVRQTLILKLIRTGSHSDLF